jgi:hypothetical protein
MSDDPGLECLIKVHGSRAFPSQAGHREVAAATSTAVIGQDVVLELASSGARRGRGNLHGLGERAGVPLVNPARCPWVISEVLVLMWPRCLPAELPTQTSDAIELRRFRQRRAE